MTRITRKQADALAEIVSNMLGLPHDITEADGALCSSCKRRGVVLEDTLWTGCRLMIQGAYGGVSPRIVHADTGESHLPGAEGYGTLREVYTFLQGMRAALLEVSDR